MEWEEKALKIMEEVPGFVRPLAKRAVEKLAKEEGLEKVTEDVALRAKAKYLGLEVEKKKKRIAIVRCDIVSEVCPGIGCLLAYENRKELFKRYEGEETSLVGFFTCGGCSGRRTFRLANTLKRYGVDVIHMSSCMLMEEPFNRCIFKEDIKKSIEALGIEVVEGTHHEVGKFALGKRFHERK
ncbi:CGGC domain-containing protein [Candidatus Pyrohabitans sp.]